MKLIIIIHYHVTANSRTETFRVIQTEKFRFVHHPYTCCSRLLKMFKFYLSDLNLFCGFSDPARAEEQEKEEEKEEAGSRRQAQVQGPAQAGEAQGKAREEESEV